MIQGDRRKYERARRMARLSLCMALAIAAAVLGACVGAKGLSPREKRRVERAEAELEALEEAGIRANPYRAGRSMAMSRKGIVATEHTLATLAGLDLLRKGGTAIDAAVGAAAVMSVVEPMMTGPGGDVWILYYEAATGRVHALNGSGRSPMGLTRDYFAAKEEPKIEDESWESVTVPGAVDAWVTAHQRFGRLPLGEVLEPAIGYATEGFVVTEFVGTTWKKYEKKLEKDRWTRETYLVGGETPRVGSVFANPNLARTLEQIASGGRDAFYRGPIAREIVRYAEETGGFLSLEDFAAHSSTWVEPISTDYRGFEVYQCPPNGQGIGVLMMLNLLEGYDLKSMKFNSPEYLHLLIEAKKLAYADLYKYVADPRASRVPIAELLSKDYAARRRKLIDLDRADPSVEPGLPAGSDTTYLTAIDEEGNCASLINSIYSAFGSGIVGGSTGVVLQNRGGGFTLEKGHANEYAPGKRPYHTIIPGMVLKEGKLYMSYGLMGGAMQPQGHVQFLLAHLEFGLTPQQAAEVPRWRHMSGREVRLEHGMARETMDALRRLGHVIVPADLGDFGAAQAILVDPQTGAYFGASDPRRDGAALGY